MKLIILLTLLILCIVSVLSTNLRTDKAGFNSSSRVDEKDKNPERVPIINVHMEEPDRDPIEVKRIEEEKRIERNRIREMEMMEEMDKRSFQQIIALQNSQLARLTAIADTSTKILNSVTTSQTSYNSGMSFKEKDTYKTVFDEMVRNGPLALD